jgi:regulator of protease activity HflC (stomatin/prohibitin superfamily)
MIVYAAAALMVAAFLAVALLPPGILPDLRARALEAGMGGLGAIVESSLLLALTAVVGSLAMTAARYRHAHRTAAHSELDSPVASSPTTSSPATNASSPALKWWDERLNPGWIARIGQAVIISSGAVLVCVSAALGWPDPKVVSGSVNSHVVASFVLALAFISLIAERTMAAFPEPQLPEAPALRRILLLATVLLAASGVLELVRSGSVSWIGWIAVALACVPCAVVVELAVRALARLFLPPPAAASATAVSNSLLASVLTGGPRSPGNFLRTHLGLDFARSWALSFLSAAVLPAIFGTALFCWALSGVKLIDLGQRGVYERFGAPVGVLGPGLHVLLPWPLGRLRPVEYGAIHSVAIGVDQTAQSTEPRISAEAPPPTQLNRLWESAHAGQANYLVPSASTGLQGFQTVSTEISVLYRVGLTDAQALDSVYTVADPEALVKESASRLVLGYFNSRTLEEVLGARRESIAEALREALVADLNSYHAGIDVVSVLIEEIHPPAGAAGAYHAVQAAQIHASASISNEVGRAKRVAGTAQQEAHQLLTAATASASETLHTANAESVRFNADRRAYADGGKSFLIERSYSNIERALGVSALTIVDHRLTPAQAPVLDLRMSPAGAAGPSGTGGAATGPPISGLPTSTPPPGAPASGNRAPPPLPPEFLGLN